jgi:hypothetical protein
MKRKLFSLFLAGSVLALIVPADAQSTTSKKQKRSSAKAQSSQPATPGAIAASANGWIYGGGEWVHPDGYKFVNGQVLRTTAKAGQPAPKPPGKLALENAQKLAPRTPGPTAADAAKAAAEKAAAERRKPWARPASQTGSNL